jgi:hypothetical protein
MPVMGLGIFDCFSGIDYSDFNTTTNVVIFFNNRSEDLEKAE